MDSQRQTIDANIFVFSVNHHVLEELIHGSRSAPAHQRILNNSLPAKYGLQLVAAKHHQITRQLNFRTLLPAPNA
ncbi:hypothetical protein LAD77_00305 [Klebsiella pneumoniae]|nr:hypothetical protein [Klebsiella pneumoniae]